MKTIRVTAAIMIEDGRVFIAQRHPDDFMGGKWEFPGGKIDPGETPEMCLRRELYEELGILTDVHDLFAVSRHTYPDRVVEILAYTVIIREGQITLHEHNDACWVTFRELSGFDMCEADLPFVEKLQGLHISKD
jgi:8-oxo-dGTP diphosphatase